MAAKSLITVTLALSLAACVPQVELVNMQSEIAALRQDAKATKARLQELQKRLNQDQRRLEAVDASVKGSGDAQNMQKAVADFGARSDQLTTDLQLIQGKLEENNFRIDEIAQKLDDKSIKIAELTERIDELEAKLKRATLGAPVTNGPGDEKEKKSAAPVDEPSEAYRQAKNDFDKGNIDLALAGFQNYLSQYPNTTLAPSAQYWVGECYYAKKDYDRAIDAFARVIKNHPKSEKMAGAKLKIGLSYLNENNTSKAREYLNRVVQEHAGGTEALIARDKLRKIGK